MNIIATALLLTTAVTWTDGETPTTIADGAVALTYDGTKVKTLTLSASADVEIEGDAMNFAADATIGAVAAGKIVFSNDVVTAGKLTVGDTRELTYRGDYISNAEFVKVFENATLSDYAVKCTYFEQTGNNLLSGTGLAFNQVRGKDGDVDTLTVQLHLWDWTYTRGVVLELRQQGADIVAKQLTSFYSDPKIYCLGEDIYNSVHRFTKDAAFFPGTKPGYGANHLVLTNCTSSVADVTFAGRLSPGGELKVSDIGKVATTGAETLVSEGGTFAGSIVANGKVSVENHAPFTLGGSLAGSGVFELLADKVVSTPVTNAPFFQVDYQVVAANRKLSSVTAVSAEMSGAFFGGSKMGRWEGCFLDYDPSSDTATCQFQCQQDANVKCAIVQLRQNGDNIEGKIISNPYKANATAGLNDMRVVYDSLQTPLGTDYKVGAYAAYNAIFTFGEGSLNVYSVNGSVNSMDQAGTMVFRGGERGSALVKIASKDAIPFSGFVDVGTNAEVRLTASGGFGAGIYSKAGAKSTYRVYPGGLLKAANSYQIPWDQSVFVYGGTFVQGYIADQYLSHVLMTDGGLVDGNETRVGFGSTSAHLFVAGTTPCRFKLPITLYGGNNVDATLFVTACDAREDGAPTLVIDSNWKDTESYQRMTVSKYGPGNVLQKGTISSYRALTVNEGTWTMGGNDGLVRNKDVTLAGGMVAVADGLSNALGTLSVTANSGLSVGAGANLSFASLDLASGKTITVAEPYVDNTLRFGTSACLDRATLKSILIGEKHAHQDDAGWIFANSGMTLILR